MFLYPSIQSFLPHFTHTPPLVSESKVPALLTLIRGVEDIVLLLLLGKSIPSPVAHLVPPDVKRLDNVEQHNVAAGNTQDDPVAPTVQRLVVVAEDVGGGNVTCLHKHVVQGGADGTGAHAVAVLGVPAYQDGVAVWVAQKTRDKSVSHPGGHVGGKDNKGENPGEDPNVGEGREHASFLDALRDPCDDEEVDGIEELRGDGEEIGLEDGETDLAQDVGQVGVEGRRRDVNHEADDVERPLLPVLDGPPESGEVDGLSARVLASISQSCAS